MTRFRAFGAAALVLVVTVVGLLALRDGPLALVTPGPLARPHAGLPCASCHEGAGERSAVDACSGCHGPHPSTRPAHAVLAQSGELDCATCHAVHRSESGLSFEPNGEVIWYATGAERPLGRFSPIAPQPGAGATAVFVPLVSRDACLSCHDVERPSDPAWSCFGPQGGGEDGFSLCFDEHRRPAEARGARGAERDAFVERARELLPRAPRERLVRFASGGATVAAGALAAGLFVAFARRRAARRARKRRLPFVAGPPGSRPLPSVDATRCLGCQACVDACPYDVLEMSRYVAVVSRPEQCCSAGTCLTACPNGSLSFRDGRLTADSAPPASRREPPERSGIRFAGDVTGGSLIRNALEQGVNAARAVAAELGSREPRRSAKRDGIGASRFDLVVVGAGPAGLAAGLEAGRLGLGVVVLEQASIAESIRRYSRDKLVLDTQPSASDDLPLFIGDSKKEELLRRWLREVRARGLDVREGMRVGGIEPSADGGFVVRAVGPSGAGVAMSCRRVVVATGRRGSPRRLDAAVPERALGRVHYELSDARTFAGSRVVVVGLGDVAMETALALALVPGTSVTMIHRGGGFSRGRQTNIERIGRRVAEGRIGIVFHAEVRAIGVERLVVEAEGSERAIPYDALFVHIGFEAPAEVPIAFEPR